MLPPNIFLFEDKGRGVISQKESGKIIVPDRCSNLQPVDGEYWEIELIEKDRFCIAKPIKRIDPDSWDFEGNKGNKEIVLYDQEVCIINPLGEEKYIKVDELEKYNLQAPKKLLEKLEYQKQHQILSGRFDTLKKEYQKQIWKDYKKDPYFIKIISKKEIGDPSEPVDEIRLRIKNKGENIVHLYEEWNCDAFDKFREGDKDYLYFCLCGFYPNRILQSFEDYEDIEISEEFRNLHNFLITATHEVLLLDHKDNDELKEMINEFPKNNKFSTQNFEVELEVQPKGKITSRIELCHDTDYWLEYDRHELHSTTIYEHKIYAKIESSKIKIKTPFQNHINDFIENIIKNKIKKREDYIEQQVKP